MLEDPNIYKSTDFCGYSASRQFPEMQLPTPGTQTPVPSTSTQVPAPSTSTAHSFVPDHLISAIQSMHDEQVKFLKPLGRNPCTHYREKDKERILNSLGPDTVLCPFCDWRCRSHEKLMSHCRKHHCKSLAYKCRSCDKVFGDPYALRIHMSLHSSTGPVHKCHICNKAYLTRSKLNEHSQLHLTGKPKFPYCDRLLADSKSLADHKKVCLKCPGVENLTDEERHPHKCPHCYRRYTRASDVHRHCKAKHPNM